MRYLRTKCTVTPSPENDTVEIVGKDVVSGKPVSLTVPLKEYMRAVSSHRVSEFKTLNDDQREFLISGISENFEEFCKGEVEFVNPEMENEFYQAVDQLHLLPEDFRYD